MDTPAARLRAARERRGYVSASSAARAFGWSVPTYSHHENGTRGIAPDVATRYAAALGTSATWILYGSGDKPPLDFNPAPQEPDLGQVRPIPVLGTAQSGIWLEPSHRIDIDSYLPVALPEFENFDLFAYRVGGFSMDKYYLPGSYVIAGHPNEINAQSGDHVLLRRHKGDLTEISVKELQTTEFHDEYWPRSNDEHFKTPIVVPIQDDGDGTPEVIGVLIASFRLLKRSP